MNVIFVSVDCFRSDATSHRFFEKLKARGKYFDTCVTQASFTSPSHMSMLSGEYPYNHGVRWLLNYETDATLVQERFKEAGFNTAAFVGGHPLPTGNASKGFDKFENMTTVEDREEGREEFAPMNVLVNEATNWLHDNEGEDNFVFIHSFDLHFTFRSELANEPAPETDEKGAFKNVRPHIGRQKRRYYEEAEFVGRQLELLDELNDVDAMVVTGDHGSKIPFEHGYPWNFNHENELVGSHFWGAELYENVVCVPFLLDAPGVNGERESRQVRSIDIVPTLLYSLDMEVPDVDGNVVTGGAPPEVAYSETYHAQLTEANEQAKRMQKKHGFGWDLTPLASVRTNEWKLICAAEEGYEPVELYNIAQDPSEAQNLVDEREDVVSEYLSILEDHVGDDEQPHRHADAVNEETRERLEDLGYL